MNTHANNKKDRTFFLAVITIFFMAVSFWWFQQQKARMLRHAGKLTPSKRMAAKSLCPMYAYTYIVVLCCSNRRWNRAKLCQLLIQTNKVPSQQTTGPQLPVIFGSYFETNRTKKFSENRSCSPYFHFTVTKQDNKCRRASFLAEIPCIPLVI